MRLKPNLEKLNNTVWLFTLMILPIIMKLWCRLVTMNKEKLCIKNLKNPKVSKFLYLKNKSMGSECNVIKVLY